MKKGDIVGLRSGGEKMVVISAINKCNEYGQQKQIIANETGSSQFFQGQQSNINRCEGNQFIETAWVDVTGNLNHQTFSANDLVVYY